jgi:hypothetical protein
LGNTNVYKEVESQINEFKKEHPEKMYYAVGHSLGGALIDVLLRKGLIKEATSYNPAIQYNDINGGLPNRRIYYGSDPLYKLMGWWDKKSEYRPKDEFSQSIPTSFCRIRDFWILITVNYARAVNKKRHTIKKLFSHRFFGINDLFIYYRIVPLETTRRYLFYRNVLCIKH